MKRVKRTVNESIRAKKSVWVEFNYRELMSLASKYPQVGDKYPTDNGGMKDLVYLKLGIKRIPLREESVNTILKRYGISREQLVKILAEQK